jgi:hypothetical protein
LPDPYARKCRACGQALYRRPPKVLGEEHRIGNKLLPIDRYMLDRMQPERRRRALFRSRQANTVAWHGKFATSARTPELEPAPGGQPIPASAPTHVETELPAYRVDEVDYDETPQQPATVGALALDVFVQPAQAPESILVEPDPAVAEPVDDVAPVVEPPAEPMMYTPPPIASTEITPPAPQARASRDVVSHEELEPEVRAIVDELYQQARAELAGNDTAFMVPTSPPVSDAPPREVQNVESPLLSDGAEAPPARGRRGWVPAAFLKDDKPRPPVQ